MEKSDIYNLTDIEELQNNLNEDLNQIIQINNNLNVNNISSKQDLGQDKQDIQRIQQQIKQQGIYKKKIEGLINENNILQEEIERIKEGAIELVSQKEAKILKMQEQQDFYISQIEQKDEKIQDLLLNISSYEDQDNQEKQEFIQKIQELNEYIQEIEYKHQEEIFAIQRESDSKIEERYEELRNAQKSQYQIFEQTNQIENQELIDLQKEMKDVKQQLKKEKDQYFEQIQQMQSVQKIQQKKYEKQNQRLEQINQSEQEKLRQIIQHKNKEINEYLKKEKELFDKIQQIQQEYYQQQEMIAELNLKIDQELRNKEIFQFQLLEQEKKYAEIVDKMAIKHKDEKNLLQDEIEEYKSIQFDSHSLKPDSKRNKESLENQETLEMSILKAHFHKRQFSIQQLKKDSEKKNSRSKSLLFNLLLEKASIKSEQGQNDQCQEKNIEINNNNNNNINDINQNSKIQTLITEEDNSQLIQLQDENLQSQMFNLNTIEGSENQNLSIQSNSQFFQEKAIQCEIIEQGTIDKYKELMQQEQKKQKQQLQEQSQQSESKKQKYIQHLYSAINEITEYMQRLQKVIDSGQQFNAFIQLEKIQKMYVNSYELLLMMNNQNKIIMQGLADKTINKLCAKSLKVFNQFNIIQITIPTFRVNNNHIEYQVNLQDQLLLRNWIFYLRFSDIKKLDSHLKNHLPSYLIKYIPKLPKTTWFKHIDKAFLLQRQNHLQSYLQTFLLNPNSLQFIDYSNVKELFLRKIYENFNMNLTNEDYLMKNWYQLIEDLPQKSSKNNCTTKINTVSQINDSNEGVSPQFLKDVLLFVKDEIKILNWKFSNIKKDIQMLDQNDTFLLIQYQQKLEDQDNNAILL